MPKYPTLKVYLNELSLKVKENPKSNSRLPRVTIKGQINPSTKVSKMAQKGKLYE